MHEVMGCYVYGSGIKGIIEPFKITLVHSIMQQSFTLPTSLAGASIIVYWYAAGCAWGEYFYAVKVS